MSEKAKNSQSPLSPLLCPKLGPPVPTRARRLAPVVLCCSTEDWRRSEDAPAGAFTSQGTGDAEFFGGGASRLACLQQTAFLPSLDAAAALAGSLAVSVLSSSLPSGVFFESFPPVVGALIEPGASRASAPAAQAAVRAAALGALLGLVAAGLLWRHRVTDELLATATALERGKRAYRASPDALVRVDLSGVLSECLQRLFFSTLLRAALQGSLATASSPPTASPAEETRAESLEPERGPRLPSSAALADSARLLSKALQRLAVFDSRVALAILEPLCDILLACCRCEGDSCSGAGGKLGGSDPRASPPAPCVAPPTRRQASRGRPKRKAKTICVALAF
ncbi:hypothetical protein BESB_078300 [Besnoitia besnoiti]|uniref:Uncharacterized protein n=1 Tax=Besnoitia besnoiti TaxID=94643 RepID=A0A2A9M8V7_BESBE|nr:hypothetical protein BESB_078300 [Besnoitia besnoiti]PFH33614.1 hypothetical protein BESB_078300 [Besnoitia besnoiti]